MNMKNLLKKTFLLLALVGGANASWAAKTQVDIPTPWGSYIDWTKAESNCTQATDQVSSTNGDDKYAEFEIYNKTQQDYIMTFATGSQSGNTAELNVVLNNGSEDILVKVAKVEDTGSWSKFNTINYYLLENLPIGTYTLRISVKSGSRAASYAGNWSKLAFYATSNYDNWPLTTSSTILDPAKSNITTSGNPQYNSETKEISYIQNGSFLEFIVNNETAQCYQLAMALNRSNHDVADVDVTITDIASGTLNAKQSFFIKDESSLTFPIANSISTGWKKVRFDFSTSVSYAPNITSLSFTPYTPDFNALPLKGTATLNLNPNTVIFNDCGYESGSGKDNIGNVKGAKPFADFYYINNTNGAAYYDLYANISWYKNEGTLKVTVTDLSTGEEESTGTSAAITSTGEIHFALNNAITSGKKSIRFDFISETTDDFLYNVKDVSFDPVSASGTITPAGWCSFASSYPLDLSTISDGSTAYYASEAEGSTVTLSTTTATVPAGEGLMIKGTPNAPFTINVAASGTAIDGNLLKGQTTTGDVAASVTGTNHYVFGYVTETPSTYGFYNLATKTEVPAGKAYLETTETLSSEARALTIVLADDILTGIEKVDKGEVESSLPVKRIVNGKLVIEKKGMMFNANGQVIK